MTPPFSPRPLQRPNWIQRLLRKKPKRNAIDQLNNRLGTGIRSVSEEELAELEATYGVNFLRDFPEERAEFYRSYLRHCFTDRRLSEDERADLAHLKRLLHLGDSTLDEIHNQVAHVVYGESVESAIADGKVSDEETRFLKDLEEMLKLPVAVAREIYRTKASALLKSALSTAVADRELSPKEEEELRALAMNLGVRFEDIESSQPWLDRYRLYWKINNGELPEIDPGIRLQRNEKCHFQCYVEWYEYRRTTRRIRYGGPTARIRLMKGVYWRMGDLAIRPVSEDVLVPIDAGPLYVTSKRLIFMGGKKNTTMRLNRILDFTPYKNGVDIQKESGKSPFLQFDENIDIFSAILGRVLADE